MIYEDIATGSRVPVDKKTSRINDGDKFESNKKIQTADQKTPFPVYDSKLDGMRFGNFTVQGYYGKPNPKKKKGLYSVRCDCGIYSLRAAKAIKNPNNNEDCCERCREVKYFRRQQRRERPT